jgi:serine/threonine protein kinase
MKCPKCHTENNPDSRFCSQCATPLSQREKAFSSPTKTGQAFSEEIDVGNSIAGRYRIIEELGEGGMGKVYKALDEEINEKVALKLLKSEIAADKEVIERFRNELKFTRKIVHKNVCRNYHLGKEKGRYFITMEYVKGEDLKSIIKMMGCLSPGKTLMIATQVCEGLAEAQRLGVVHRDLKPQNIMIDRDGDARIMDFGIARWIDARGITASGVMIGTPDYMSPEQAEGREIDHRSDIYSFGIILYEMVTGKVPFKGSSPINIALKHKSEIPKPPRDVNPQIPEILNKVILKCIEKRKDKRYQDAEALLADLAEAEKILPSTAKILPIKNSVFSKEITVTLGLKKLLTPVVLILVFAIFTTLVFLFLKGPGLRKPKIPQSSQMTFTGSAYLPALSPDGKFIAYINRISSQEKRITIQDLASGQDMEVLRTKSCLSLRWSPDSSTLSFWAETEDYGEGAFTVSRLGGRPRPLGTNACYLAWSHDGLRIACGRNVEKNIYILDRQTGNSTIIPLEGDFLSILGLDWSPVQELIAYLTFDEKERYTIWIINSIGGNQHKIIEENVPIYSPRWSPEGNAIYYLRGRCPIKDLCRIPVSPKTGKVSRSEASVLTRLQTAGTFTLSKEGKDLLYAKEFLYANIWMATFKGAENNRIVEKRQLTKGTLLNDCPALSPDGTHIAYSAGDGETGNIYVLPVEGGSPKQVTFLEALNQGPVWSPDGKKIAFGSNKGGEYRVWKVSAGSGILHQFSGTRLSGNTFSLAWSPGTNILYHRPGNSNFYILDPASGKERALVENETEGWLFAPRYSPDGKKVAIHWNRKPSRGIWVVSVEDSNQKLIREGYVWPIGWSEDGKWIYASEDGQDGLNVLMISAEGEYEKQLATIPFDMENRILGSLCMTFDGEHLIFPVYEVQSDVWMIENFDPKLW